MTREEKDAIIKHLELNENAKPNDALKKAAEKYKEEIHPDSAYGQWMKRFNNEEK
jgi:hypothetical protein